MANNTQHEYLNTSNEKPSTVLTTVHTELTPKTARLGSIVGLIIASLLIIIPILQFYIGRRYANECPIDRHIPLYSVVAGIIGIIVVILGIIQNILTLKISTTHAEQTQEIDVAYGLLCVVCLHAILLFFLFVWFIAGCIWIFRVWNNVQYVDPNQGDYCHPVLYRFAFWLLIIALIFKILSCCQSCWKIPFEVRKFTNARSTLATTEP